MRALTPELADAPALPPNMEVMRCNFADEASLPRAVEGVEAAFLACPYTPQITEAHMRFVRVAKSAGMQRLVQLSGVGANAAMCCARMLRWFGEAEGERCSERAEGHAAAADDAVSDVAGVRADASPSRD